MDRRGFMKSVAAAGIGSALGGAAHNARGADEDRGKTAGALERRVLGRTGERLSILGFGGVLVNGVSPDEASSRVAEAVDKGINYFDVAPTYGNAEERLGPALKPYRDRCFLADKTQKRTADEAREELENSLRLMQTDHFDLYQFHAVNTVEDVDTILGEGGAMEAVLKAREEGKVRYIGFSSHGSEAALALLERHEFDTILFPFNYACWFKADFGPQVFETAREQNLGLLALKSMVRGKWKDREQRRGSEWPGMWYMPLEAPDPAGLGLRFALHLPVTAAIPPGRWELFRHAVEMALKGEVTPLAEAERERLRRIAMEQEVDPLFG